MDLIRAGAFVHIVFSIVLTGLALYWLIMESALRRRHPAAEAGRLLGVAMRARWPHVVVPQGLRIPLPWMSWLAIAVLAATGAAAVALRGAPVESLWWIKLALFVALIVVQVPLTRTPTAMLVRANFALVVATILVSAWAIR